MRLTDSEWKIANCLWNNKCMTLTELTRELLDSTGWTKYTIITLLKRMIDNLIGSDALTEEQLAEIKKMIEEI